MDGHIERFVDATITGPPAEEPPGEDQVAARRHREELGQALDDAKDDGVKERHLRAKSRAAAAPPTHSYGEACAPSMSYRRPSELSKPTLNRPEERRPTTAHEEHTDGDEEHASRPFDPLSMPP